MAKRKRRYLNPCDTGLRGIKDLFTQRPSIPGLLLADERQGGLTLRFTGAGVGSGCTAFMAVAGLGARAIMLRRTGIPEKAQEMQSQSGNAHIEMFHVDFADFTSAAAICHTGRASVQ